MMYKLWFGRAVDVKQLFGVVHIVIPIDLSYVGMLRSAVVEWHR